MKSKGKKKKKFDKKACQTFHFQKRFFHRVGYSLPRELRLKILEDIQLGKTSIVHRQSNTKTVHEIFVPQEKPSENANVVKESFVKKIPIYVVYDKSRKSLVTVLLKDKYDEGKKERTLDKE